MTVWQISHNKTAHSLNGFYPCLISPFMLIATSADVVTGRKLTVSMSPHTQESHDG